MSDGVAERPRDVGAEMSVIVSTYDAKRWQDLTACLESLQRQRLRPREVILVVDHNPELFAAARVAFPWAEVVENRRPRGLAGARNTGVEEATAPIVAFIDDDAAADPDWLWKLSVCFEDRATVGAGGALIPRWQNGVPRWMPSEFYWVIGCSYTGLPEQMAPVRNPIGANMAVRTEALRAVGGFREGGEHDQPREIRSRGVVRAGGNVPDDTDLAIRVGQSLPSAVWLYQPEATVHHSVTRERASLAYFFRRSFEEGVGKASLARVVGAQAGLASERRHAAVVLPRGVARELRRFLSGDGSAALRALAIVAGTIATAAGFLAAALKHPVGRRR
jgi:Glycosyl transferase family 2